MARIYYSALVSGIRGRINGNMFSSSLVTGTGVISGANNRSHSKLTKADAGRFAQVKRTVTAMSTGWANLTTDQKTAWNEFAAVTPHKNRFGDNVKLSGFQQFIMINQRLLLNAGGALSVPPTPVIIPDLMGITVTTSVGDEELIVKPGVTVAAPWQFVVYTAAQRAPGRAVRTRNTKWTEIGAVDSGVGVNCWNSYTTLFGQPQTGNAIDFSAFMINLDTGQTSNIMLASATIEA